MATKTTSCLKEALLLLTRVPRLLAPFLLFALIGIVTAFRFVYVNPLTAEMSRHLHAIEEHMDPSSAEYARLLEETQHDATWLLVIAIAVALVTLTLAFARQIVTRCFTASRTTHPSGDRYSLAELLCEVTKWDNLKVPLVMTAVLVTVLQIASMALLGGNFATVMRDSGLLSVPGSLFLVVFLVFFYVVVLALTSVEGKEWSVLVLLTLLLPALLIPVCAVAVLCLYTEQVMGLGISLLSVYDLLQGVQDLLYLSAASVYCCYYQAESTKMVAACDGEKMSS